MVPLGDLLNGIKKRRGWSESSLKANQEDWARLAANPIDHDVAVRTVNSFAEAVRSAAEVQTYSDALQFLSASPDLASASRKLTEFVRSGLIRLGRSATENPYYGSPIKDGLAAEVRQAEYRALCELDAMANHFLSRAAEEGQ